MRVLFALAGLHRVNRGAEIALESVARELARMPGWDVTLLGTGPGRTGEPYRYLRGSCVPRERFERCPRLPVLRNEYVYEELTFVPSLLRRFRPRDFDLTSTCAYPFTNWVLRARRRRRGTASRRPLHVFITQNGDWPARARSREYRFFGCDALVCINPEHQDRHRDRWPTLLVPNGVDVDDFSPGRGDRSSFGLPEGPLALMVSALIPSKRVVDGIDAVALLSGVGLAIAGDGPMRDEVRARGRERLGDRFVQLTVPRERMPDLYRCADALVHMSLDEPFGNIYVEALAVGLPCVTHRTRTTEWILGEHAELVDAADPGQVAAGLDRLLRGESPERRGRLRAACEARFSWSRIAQDYAAFYRTLAEERT